MKENIPKYEQVTETRRKTIFINNFIGGIAWALGSTIGLTVIVALISFILRKVDLIPLIGSYIAQLNSFIANHPK